MMVPTATRSWPVSRWSKAEYPVNSTTYIDEPVTRASSFNAEVRLRSIVTRTMPLSDKSTFEAASFGRSRGGNSSVSASRQYSSWRRDSLLFNQRSCHSTYSKYAGFLAIELLG